MRSFWVILFLLKFVFFFSFSAFANSNICRNLFIEDGSTYLDRAIQLEDRIYSLDVSANNLRDEHGRAIDLGIEDLKFDLGRLIDDLESPEARKLIQQLEKAVDKIQYKVDRVQEERALFLARKRNTDLNKLAEEPNLARYNFRYNVVGLDPRIRSVTFSKEVVEEIFWSKEPLLNRASRLIIRAILRGRQGATDKSGIFPFISDSSIVKVKIIGQAVGAIRVVGFIEDSDLYLITWDNESSHGHHNSGKMIETVNRARRTIDIGPP